MAVIFNRIFRHPPLAKSHQTNTHTYTQYASSSSSSSSPPSSSVTSYVSTDLFPPRLILSSKDFQVVSVHSVYNSALFLPSRCCSFLLHVVANWICIFLVSSGTGSACSSYQNLFIPFVVKSKATLLWNPQGSRKRGRPKNSWRRSVIKEAGRSWNELMFLAADRQKWKELIYNLCS